MTDRVLPHHSAGPAPIKVLIVDDSALVRQLLTAVFADNPEFLVVGTAADPIIARDKIKSLNPDVITLDIEMPRMNGIEFLERIMRLRPLPVVMISTLTRDGADITLQALELGAVDYVAKPTTQLTESMADLKVEIQTKVRTAARARLRAGTRPTRPVIAPRMTMQTDRLVIGIGASTGGVEALGTVLGGLSLPIPGIVIVQHMPPSFTGRFAARLNDQLPFDVFEACDGMRVESGRVIIGPGGRHLRIIGDGGGGLICRLDDSDPVSGHRPSVDVLFQSLAPLGRKAAGVLLTGMGRDGAEGLLAMRKAGALTIAQDQATSVVYGMPRAAVEIGAVGHELPLSRIATSMIQMTV
jgi:two-component system chemotaxis response regulator CheB